MLRISLAALFVLALPMSHADDVEAACQRLIMDYAWYRDHPDAEAYGNLFTEDGTLTLFGETFRGRDAIRQRLISPTGGGTLHQVTTLRVRQTGPDSAEGQSYVTVYVFARGDDPHVVPGFAGVGEYHDLYQRTADGWRIASRTLKMRLQDADALAASEVRR
ncbi:MAG: nuclear transport factor 2 family protein [Pseudomonadales bacterium]|nr:nuclear transport factor 2 family protein [Pseudomonadales bacterium]